MLFNFGFICVVCLRVNADLCQITNAKVKGAVVDGPMASISGKNQMNCSVSRYDFFVHFDECVILTSVKFTIDLCMLAGRAYLMDPLSATMLKHLKDLGAKCRKFKKGWGKNGTS